MPAIGSLLDALQHTNHIEILFICSTKQPAYNLTTSYVVRECRLELCMSCASNVCCTLMKSGICYRI